MRTAVLGLALITVIVGCGGAARGSRGPAPDTCSKEWDLGTGSASDIERLAPDFAGTESRLRDVAAAELPPGMTAHRLANYGVEIRTVPIRKEKIRVLRPPRDRTTSWLMLIPGECHRLVATKSCAAGRPKLAIATSGSSPCIAGQSIEGIEVTADLRGTGASPLPPFKPVRIGKPPKEVTLFLGSGSKRLTAETTAHFDPETTEEEVLTLIGSPGDLAFFAQSAYRAMKDPSPEFDRRVAQARLDAGKAHLARVDDPNDVLGLIFAGEPMADMPGSEAVKPLIVQRLVELLDAAASDPSKHGFATVLPLFTFHQQLAGPVPSKTAGLVEQAYGPAMAQAEKKDQDAFLRIFPDGKFGDGIRAAQKERSNAAQAASDAKEKAWKKDDLWDTLKEEGDQLAQLKYKIRYATQHFPGTRRNKQGIRNMQLHYAAIVRDSFCPAKREFSKLMSTAEFAKRSKAHCDDEPPTIWSDSGEEIALTADCRAAFASGC